MGANQQINAETILRNTLEDLVKNGLHADRMPTMRYGFGEDCMYSQWVEYLRHIEDTLKNRAAAALETAKRADERLFG